MGKLWMIGLLVLVTMVQECKEATEPDGGIPSDMVGTWYATSFTFANRANLTQIDNVLNDGGSFTLVINENGSYTATMVNPYSNPEVMTGTMTVNGSQITTVENGETSTMTYTLVSGVLTLASQNETYDFNDDGVDESAVMTIVMSKTAPTSGGNTPTEVVGTWDATSYLFVNNANSSQTFEAISAGAAWSITINANGTFTGSWTSPGETIPQVDSGTMIFNGNMAIATTADGPTYLTWSVAGNAMVVVFQEPFDFDDNGTDEDATVTCTLAKR